jgi:hypothetical protein
MINITRRGWLHIQKYHTGMQSTRQPKKSTFNDAEDLIQLLNEASRQPPCRTDQEKSCAYFRCRAQGRL